MTVKVNGSRKRRKPVSQSKAERRMRVVALTGAVPIAAWALYVSAGHIQTVALAAGEAPGTAATMWVSVDAFMIVSGVAILARRAGKLAYLAFGLALAGSLAANVLSAQGSVVSYVVAGWPALTVALTGEMLLRLLHPRKPARRKPRARQPARVPAPARAPRLATVPAS